MRVVILGVDYLVGSIFARYLIPRMPIKDLVFCSSEGSAPRGIFQRFDLHLADVRYPESLKHIFQENDIVVNGQVDFSLNPRLSSMDSMILHRQGLINLLAIAKEKKVKQVISVVPMFLSWNSMKFISPDSDYDTNDPYHLSLIGAIEVCKNYFSHSDFGTPSNYDEWMDSIRSSEGTGFKSNTNEDPSESDKNIKISTSSPNLDGKPNVPNLDGKPSVPNLDGKPSVPNLDGKPSVPNLDGKPSVPNLHGKPNVPNLDGKPSVPNLDNKPSIPNLDGKPSVPNLDGKSSVPNLDGKPSVPNLDGKPSVPNLDGKPSVPNLDNKPGIPNLDGKPNVPNLDGKSSVPNLDGKPSVPNLDGKPNVPNLSNTVEESLDPDLSDQPSEKEEPYYPKLSILRPGFYFGAFDRELTFEFCKGVKLQRISLPSSGKNKISWITELDLSRAIALLINKSSEGMFSFKSFDASPIELLEAMSDVNHSEIEIERTDSLFSKAKSSFSNFLNRNILESDYKFTRKSLFSNEFTLNDEDTISTLAWKAKDDPISSSEAVFDWFTRYILTPS